MGLAQGVRAGVTPLSALAVTPEVFNASTVTRGRAYFYHGLRDWPASFSTTSPFSSFITLLRADGWQVVVPGEMYDGSSQDTLTSAAIVSAGDSGTTFRNDVIALHHATKAWVDQNYGRPKFIDLSGTDTGLKKRELLIGMSWGGLMVGILACSGVPCRGFQMLVPATDPHYLTEFSAITTTNVLPTSLGSNVENVPGWVAYSTSDTRVGYTHQQTLAANMNAAHSNVTVRGGSGDSYYITLGHAATTTTNTDMANWIAATIT